MTCDHDQFWFLDLYPNHPKSSHSKIQQKPIDFFPCYPLSQLIFCSYEAFWQANIPRQWTVMVQWQGDLWFRWINSCWSALNKWIPKILRDVRHSFIPMLLQECQERCKQAPCNRCWGWGAFVVGKDWKQVDFMYFFFRKGRIDDFASFSRL